MCNKSLLRFETMMMMMMGPTYYCAICICTCPQSFTMCVARVCCVHSVPSNICCVHLWTVVFRMDNVMCIMAYTACIHTHTRHTFNFSLVHIFMWFRFLLTQFIALASTMMMTMANELQTSILKRSSKWNATQVWMEFVAFDCQTSQTFAINFVN